MICIRTGGSNELRKANMLTMKNFAINYCYSSISIARSVFFGADKGFFVTIHHLVGHLPFIGP